MTVSHSNRAVPASPQTEAPWLHAGARDVRPAAQAGAPIPALDQHFGYFDQ